jgi:transcriptional regulator with XRE-family HTH domain
MIVSSIDMFTRHVYTGGVAVEVDDVRLYRTLGTRLRRKRLETGLTQGQLADAADVLRTSIANIEAGRQKPPLHVLYRICAVLEVEVSTILPALADITQRALTTAAESQPVEAALPKTASFLQQLLNEASQSA